MLTMRPERHTKLPLTLFLMDLNARMCLNTHTHFFLFSLDGSVALKRAALPSMTTVFLILARSPSAPELRVRETTRHHVARYGAGWLREVCLGAARLGDVSSHTHSLVRSVV